MQPDQSRHIQWACAAAAMLGCAAAHAAVTDGLEAYWALDETSGATAFDSAHSYDAALTGASGGPALHQPGVIGTAYHFDDTQDDLGTVDTAPTIATNFTFTGWINADTTRSGTNAASRSAVFGQATTALLVSIGEAGTAGNPAKVIVFDGVTTSKTSQIIAPGNWYHVAYTRDGGDLAVYVNGIEVLTGTTTAGDSAISEMLLGRYATQDGRDWDGLLDDLGLWSSTRSDQDIALIHGLGLFAGVALNDTAIDDVLAVFNAASGSANAGGYEWSYATGLGSSTVGATGGSAAGLDAFIVLDGSGNGVQITALVPEPASLGLLTLATLALVTRRRA